MQDKNKYTTQDTRRYSCRNPLSKFRQQKYKLTKYGKHGKYLAQISLQKFTSLCLSNQSHKERDEDTHTHDVYDKKAPYYVETRKFSLP